MEQNNRISSDIIKLKKQSDFNKTKEDNETLVHKLTREKKEKKLIEEQLKEFQELKQRNKNLEFMNNLLNQERESMLEQFTIYESIIKDS